MVHSQEVWLGEVDRISGSGNAIVDEENIDAFDETESQIGREINLGPLPREIVGAKVQFAYKQGTFGFCLDPRYIDQEYVQDFGKRAGIDSFEVGLEDLLVGNDLPEKIEPESILLAEHLLSNSESGLSVDGLDGWYLAKITPVGEDEWSCFGVVENLVIQDDIPVPVKVTDVHSNYVETKGAIPQIKKELPDIGEIITVTTDREVRGGTLATYETDYIVPIFLKDARYPQGEALKIKITDFNDTHATGEAVFSADEFDTIEISDNEILRGDRQSQNRIIDQEVPIDVEPVPEDAPVTNKILVTDESKNALIGRWDIKEKIGSIDISKGDQIKIEVGTVNGDSCIGYYKRFPVRVNFTQLIPAGLEGEHLSVSIQAVQADNAIGEPAWVKQTEGAFEVRIIGKADDAFAVKESHPILIPNSSVVSTGDRILVGVSEIIDDNVAVGTISSRPVFNKGTKFCFVRLPHTQDNVVTVDRTPVVVDHLPDIDVPVTLGVDQVNEDHVVPTVSALPKTHLPDKGDYVSSNYERIVDNMIVRVGEELPISIPLLPISQENDAPARIVTHRSEFLLGAVRDVSGSTDNNIWPVYESLHLAGLSIEQEKYSNAVKHLTEATQSCPSELSVLEQYLAVQKALIRTITAIRDSTEIDQTIQILSQEADRLSKFVDDHQHAGEISAILSAHESEIRAAERFLTALEEVDPDNMTGLQAIAHGVSAKAIAIESVEQLAIAEDAVNGTAFEEQIPSLAIRAVIEEFSQAFPAVVNEIQVFDTPEKNPNWFQHLLPEWITDHTSTTVPNADSDGNTWQRPAVPETMGIVPVTETEGSDNAIENNYLTTTGSTQATNTNSAENGDRTTNTTSTTSKSGTTDTTSSTSENGTNEQSAIDEPIPVPGDTSQLQELRKKAEEEASESPEREHVETVNSRYRRSPAVRNYALERADGSCELCGEPAPFLKQNDEPFLEVHHVDELGKGGADDPSQVCAVCPNCHKEIHHGKSGDELNEQLRQRLEKGLADVGAVDD